MHINMYIDDKLYFHSIEYAYSIHSLVHIIGMYTLLNDIIENMRCIEYLFVIPFNINFFSFFTYLHNSFKFYLNK